jgi:hypothetical protein
MNSENLEMETAAAGCVFAPEEVESLRASFGQAWKLLPVERRTPENGNAIATEIVRIAKSGERDPARLSKNALKAIASE